MECKRDSFNGSLGGASETHWECVSHKHIRCSAESATEAISLALHSIPHVFHLALRRCETLWSAREIAPMAVSAEQARHIALRQCETHSPCVSFTPPRAPLKQSLLHFIVFHIALRACETLWNAREITFSGALGGGERLYQYTYVLSIGRGCLRHRKSSRNAY